VWNISVKKETGGEMLVTYAIVFTGNNNGRENQVYIPLKNKEGETKFISLYTINRLRDELVLEEIINNSPNLTPEEKDYLSKKIKTVGESVFLIVL
jgi:uncharacterized protein YrzB (UPF0473 family)